MITVRSPLRITLGGGGTDLPSYYERHGGFVISAAIDKYVYITIHRAFEPGFILKYSRQERVRTAQEIEHPIFREALRGEEDALEITSLADIPAGTGLGSSGSFTTALLKALHALKGNSVDPAALAEQACDIEMNRLGDPVGKQDPYIAAFGGLTCFQFCPRGKVQVSPLRIPDDARRALQDNLLLFFTGYSRSASGILRDQDSRTRSTDRQMLDNLHFVKELGYQSRQALESADLAEFVRLMDVHWNHKKRRSPGMSNREIDAMYDYALHSGALGGKLIGAGGGGFLMFYTEDHAKLRRAMRERGLPEIRFRFEGEGTTIVSASPTPQPGE